MRFISLAPLASAAIVALFILHPIRSQAASPPPVVHVVIENYAFQEASVSVPPGTTVVWKNLDDDPHTVTATDGAFDSKGLAQGDTFSYRFDKPGTYTYYCKVHPMMKGTVVVKDGQS